MTSKELAVKITKYIMGHSPVAYDELEARAKMHGYDLNLFDQAMQTIHRFEGIDNKAVIVNGKSVIVYAPKKKAPVKEAMVRWVNIPGNYPVMDETNDCHHEIFDGIDCSFLFMRPEEAEEYWNNKKPVWMR
jgi:hypothetical protein